MYRARGYASVNDVLRLHSGHVLIVVQRADGRRFILRSTDTAGRRFGRPVFAFPFDSRVHSFSNAPGLLSGESWLQLGKAVYIGEYGNRIEPVFLWKSTDDGRSFQVASSFTGVAHVHSIFADPYVRGRLWIAIGDNRAEPRIGYSSDGGATFTWITQGRYPESRAVGLTFTKDAVFWASDTPEIPAGLYRWDRSAKTITKLSSNTNGPWFFVAQAHGVLAQFSYIDSRARAGYLGDEFVHVLTSQGGRQWTNTRTTLQRDPSALAADIKAGPITVTTPDRQGRFWVYFYELQGGQGFTTNAEFRLGG